MASVEGSAVARLGPIPFRAAMKRRHLLPVLFVLVLALAPGVARAQPTYHDVETFDLTGTWVENPCSGEWVVLDGQAHFVDQVLSPREYGWQMMGVVNGMGLTATGLDTGTVYRATSADMGLTVEEPQGAEVVRGAGAFVLVGPDPADHFVLHASIGYTVTPTGDLIYSGGGYYTTCPGS
jgi:hypothetical protein